MNWKAKLYNTAYRIEEEYRLKEGVIGTAIGGSIAKGKVWKYSDLELCLLVDEYNKELDYFNYINGLGVELIQLTKSKIQDFIRDYEQSGNRLGAIKFPIQVYQCRIIHDPEGLLTKFKSIYDQSLFDKSVKKIKQEKAANNADEKYELAVRLLQEGNHKSALGSLRLAVNELLLAYYWHNGILPRSQNRTVYLLKKQSPQLGGDALYKAFTTIFGVLDSKARMKQDLLKAKSDVFEITRSAWGDNTPEFLEKACDGQLEWGYESSILYVYKWCIHSIHSKEMAGGVYDRTEFARDRPALHRFLGFEYTSPEQVSNWLIDYKNVRNKLTGQRV